MCGITGIFNINNKSHIVDSRLLFEMTKAVAHRGPDDEGYVILKDDKYIEYVGPDSATDIKNKHANLLDYKAYSGTSLMFGHRRLSILDTSSAGHQPMISSDRRYALIHNGEIYNFIEIRQELTSLGYTFHTNSDTEVVLNAYMQWHDDCFSKFNGMWAIAIFDRLSNILTLCRDRIGKVPLYVWKDNNNIVFASEIKSILLCISDSEKHLVNEDVIEPYLLYGTKDYSTKTFYKNIKSLPPATIRHYSANGTVQDVQYWSLPGERKSPAYFGGYQNATNTLMDLLRSATEIRLRADVPLALELSGGMDSSTLVALAYLIREKRIPTYTVRFSNPAWNEEPYARLVAEKYKIDYRVLEPPISTFWSEVDDFVFIQEEPFHSPNLHTLRHVQQIMANEGFKVVISGAGGDELFAGYYEYYLALLRHYWHKKQLIALVKQLSNVPEGKYTHAIKELLLTALMKIFRAQNLHHNRMIINNLQLNYGSPRALDVVKDKWAPIEKLLVSNMNLLKMPYWLRSGDITRMSIPVERRAPFLDYRVIEYAFTLPLEWLISKGWMKWILRGTCEPILPREVVWRKQKMGFPFPLPEWLEKSNKEIQLALNDIRNNPYLKYKSRDVINLTKVNPSLAWRIISFEMWHKRMIRGKSIL